MCQINSFNRVLIHTEPLNFKVHISRYCDVGEWYLCELCQ